MQMMRDEEETRGRWKNKNLSLDEANKHWKACQSTNISDKSEIDIRLILSGKEQTTLLQNPSMAAK